MKERLMEVGRVVAGNYIRWDHGEWVKVEDAGPHLNAKPNGPKDPWDGWTYLKLEGHPKTCTIWHDIELPWKPW